MNERIRKVLYRPIEAGTFKGVIPELTIRLKSGNQIKASASVGVEGDKFRFEVYFTSKDCPDLVEEKDKTAFTRDDLITLSGRINDEIFFECRDVFPVGHRTTGTYRKAMIVLHSTQMHIVEEDRKPPLADFITHIVFHGPKLLLKSFGAVSETVTRNEYLGDITRRNSDTYLFSHEKYEGALIQQGDELHLHARAKQDGALIDNPKEFVEHLKWAVGFSHGFLAWPLYYSFRMAKGESECWIAPRLNMKQSPIAPINERLTMRYWDKPDHDIFQIIPVFADGLSSLSADSRQRLDELEWIVKSTSIGEQPDVTKLLIVCSALDGLMKNISDKRIEEGQKNQTDKIWRCASDKLGFNWDECSNHIFETFGKYRNDLAHGRLWLSSSQSFGEITKDYHCLAHAFLLYIAAWLGYKSAIIKTSYPMQFTYIDKPRKKPSPQQDS